MGSLPTPLRWGGTSGSRGICFESSRRVAYVSERLSVVDPRPARLRTFGLLVGVGMSTALVLGGAASASAAALITPSSGPAAGGTTVSFAAATLGFTQVAQGGNSGYGLSGD